MAESKIALITGANKGIGKEIARQLGAQGLTVLLGARDAKRGEEAASELRQEGLTAHSVLLDVTDQASIDAAAKHIEAEFGKLDVLVNNAGIALDNGPASEMEIETLRRTYDTNVFGVFAVTKAFLPLLKKAEAGRIVNLSSGLGSLTQNSDPAWEFAFAKPLAYNSSKAALNMMTVILAAEMKNTALSRSMLPTPATLPPPTSISIAARAPWSREPLPPSAWRYCPQTGRQGVISMRAAVCRGKAAKQTLQR